MSPTAETKQGPKSSHRQSQPSGHEARRSRNGCAICRKRKIKCDEAKPECGQCLKTGRTCYTIDKIFKQHRYSFLISSQSLQTENSKVVRFPGNAQNGSSTDNKTEAFSVARETDPPVQFVMAVEPPLRTSESHTPEESPALLTQHGEPAAPQIMTEIIQLRKSSSEKERNYAQYAGSPSIESQAGAGQNARSYVGDHVKRSRIFSEWRQLPVQICRPHIDFSSTTSTSTKKGLRSSIA
ncbi:hypothetical protein V1509DRAFT_613418, partial [Lipomyces kononenkoae]